MSTAVRHGRSVRQLALVPGVAFLAALCWLWTSTGGFVITDTFQVLDGAARADNCLKASTLVDCGPGVGQYPLLQYIPALVTKHLGGSYGTGVDTLVLMSGAALLGLLALGWWLGRSLERPRLGALFAVVIVASPAIWYSHTGYGELLAACANAAIVIGIVAGAPLGLVALAVFGAVISKETAFVFVAAVALLAARAAVERGRPYLDRRRLLILGGALACGIAANAAFNVFRYGSLQNHHYFDSALRVPVGHGLLQTAAVLLAPGGGLLWMWPLALFVIAAGAVVAVRSRRSMRELLLSPGLGAAVVLLVVSLQLGFWISPLGGVTWGPRLLVPWVPALCALALAAAPDWFDSLTRRATRTTVAAVASFLVVLALGLPHLAVTIDSAHHAHPYPGWSGSADEAVMRQYLPDASCPQMPSVYVNQPVYYACQDHYTWTDGIALGQAKRAVSSHLWPYALLFAAAAAGLLAAVRRSHRY